MRHWTLNQLRPAAEDSFAGRSFSRGKAAFEAAACLKCHRFGEEGADGGPSLTTVGNRFSAADLLEAIVQPSKVVSDQYASTDLVLKNHDVVNGWIMREDEKQVVIRPSLVSSGTITVAKEQISARRRSPVSAMPDGLLDILSHDEIADVIAYLRSAANPQDEAFSP